MQKKMSRIGKKKKKKFQKLPQKTKTAGSLRVSSVKVPLPIDQNATRGHDTQHHHATINAKKMESQKPQLEKYNPLYSYDRHHML